MKDIVEYIDVDWASYPSNGELYILLKVL